MERRLAAILAADLTGYSALMERDETGTFEILGEARDAIVVPTIESHKGRIVKLMGDGLLAEFPSVIEATACGVKIQELLEEAAYKTPDGTPLQFRIGINLGDVIAQDGDIYGDGVNVAARVEALAPPGEVCITRSVRDQIRDRLDLVLDDWGQISVKNLSRPVRVFRIVRDPDEARTLAAHRSARRRSRLGFGAAALGVAAFLIATETDRAPELPPEPAPRTAPDWTVAETEGSVRIRAPANIRLGPGLTHDIALVARPGTRYTLTGEVTGAGAGRWLRLDVPGQPEPVYVHASLANVIGSDSDPTDALRPTSSPQDPIRPAVVRPEAVEEPDPVAAAAAVVAPPASEKVWVSFSLDFSDEYFNDCTHFRSRGSSTLSIGGSWQPVDIGRDFDLRVFARAERMDSGLSVRIWPYKGRWPESAALRVALSNTNVGTTGRAFTARRAEPPFHQCGGFEAYVSIAEEPELD
ncbi:MAG: adenylate/guanylate cyclase domain-containing protein [Pseudomonadota bacterium]